MTSPTTAHPPGTAVIRAARAEDTPGLTSLFLQAYADCSHPCKDLDFVRSTIGSPSFHWRVATVEGEIVACSAVVRHPWNRTWEIGRGVTHPAYRGAGIGAQLCQECVSTACEQPDCDWIHGFPRNATIAKIAAQVRPGLRLTGHDGGINIANGIREYHGVIFAPNPYSSFRHISPPHVSPFVRHRVFAALGACPVPGHYPETSIVGPGLAPAEGTPFSFAYEPRCSSRSLEITGYFGDARAPVDLARELTAALTRFPHAAHVRLAVLADKVSFLQLLASQGFEVTAYLPAWYAVDQSRYDCVLVVRRYFHWEPAHYGLGEIVSEFREGLNPW